MMQPNVLQDEQQGRKATAKTWCVPEMVVVQMAKAEHGAPPGSNDGIGFYS